MNVLLVDISNGRSKFMRAENGLLLAEKRVIATADLEEGAIRELLYGWSYESAVIASVVPQFNPVLRHGVGCPCHFLNWESPHGLSFSLYPDYEHLGADRIANAIAIANRGKSLAIAVDLGTAVTYDVVKVDNCGQAFFLGGVIAAGLGTLRTALHDRTALLPAIALSLPSSWLGKNTRESLLSGALLGFVGMVRETLSSLAYELDESPYVVATGGDSGYITSKVAMIDDCDENLTFKGLLAVSKLL